MSSRYARYSTGLPPKQKPIKLQPGSGHMGFCLAPRADFSSYLEFTTQQPGVPEITHPSKIFRPNPSIKFDTSEETITIRDCWRVLNSAAPSCGPNEKDIREVGRSLVLQKGSFKFVKSGDGSEEGSLEYVLEAASGQTWKLADLEVSNMSKDRRSYLVLDKHAARIPSVRYFKFTLYNVNKNDIFNMFKARIEAFLNARKMHCTSSTPAQVTGPLTASPPLPTATTTTATVVTAEEKTSAEEHVEVKASAKEQAREETAAPKDEHVYTTPLPPAPISAPGAASPPAASPPAAAPAEPSATTVSRAQAIRDEIKTWADLRQEEAKETLAKFKQCGCDYSKSIYIAADSHRLMASEVALVAELALLELKEEQEDVYN